MFLQDEIDAAVKALLALKANYKAAAGKDWKPGHQPAAKAMPQGDELNEKITAQGNKVRDLKSKKAPKVRTSLLQCPSWFDTFFIRSFGNIKYV